MKRSNERTKYLHPTKAHLPLGKTKMKQWNNELIECQTKLNKSSSIMVQLIESDCNYFHQCNLLWSALRGRNRNGNDSLFCIWVLSDLMYFGYGSTLVRSITNVSFTFSVYHVNLVHRISDCSIKIFVFSIMELQRMEDVLDCDKLMGWVDVNGQNWWRQDTYCDTDTNKLIENAIKTHFNPVRKC